jgi:Ca2+-binding EF-hand superfamily protein
MAFSLTSRELESLEETFLAFDKTGKGTITLQELADVMHEHMGDVSSGEVQRIFESLDFAQEEEVHYTPFIAAMLATRVRLHEDKVRAAFDKFDHNNTGFITADSLVAMFAGLDGPAGAPLTKVEAEQWITEVDYKRNGVIDYEGFMSALMGKRLWELPALNDEEQPTVKVYQDDGDLLRARSDDALFIPGSAESKIRHDLAAILIDGAIEESRDERKTQSFPTVMPSGGSGGDIKQMYVRSVACDVDEDHFTR